MNFEDLVRRLLKGASFYTSAIELDQYGEDPVDGEKWEKEARALIATGEADVRESYRCHDHVEDGDHPLICSICSKPADAVHRVIVHAKDSPV